MELTVYDEVNGRDKLLWTITNISGYIYAYLLAKYIENPDNQYKIVLLVDKSRRYYDANRMVVDEHISPEAYIRGSYDSYSISNKFMEHTATPGVYQYWLANIGSMKALVHDNNLEYLYGVLNGAKHGGVPASDIILTLPLKDGQWYNIEGLKLQYPDNLK